MMQHRVQQFVVQYLPSGLLNMNTPSGPPSAAHGHHHHQQHHHQHHHHGHHHHHHHAGGLSPPTKGLGFFAPPTSAPFSGPLLEPGYPISSAPSFAPPSATTVFSAPSPKPASWHPRRAGIFNSYGPAPSPHLSARSDDTNVVATPWWLVVVIGGLFVVFIAVIVWICIRKRRGRQAVDPCSELKSIRIDPRGGDEGLVFYNVTVNKVFNLQDDTEQQQQQAAVESVKDGVDNGLEFENVPLSKVIDLSGDEMEQQQELATVDSVEGLVFYNVPLSKVINLENDTEQQQQQQEDDAEDDARQQRLHQAAVKFLKESAESLAEAERQKRQQREQMFCAQAERILRGRDEHAAYDAWIEQQAHAEVRLRSNENQQLRLIEDEQREQLICLVHADCINRCSCNKKRVLHDDDDQSRVWEKQQQQSTHGFPKKFEDEEGKKSRPDSNQQNWQQQERAQEEQSRSEDRRIRKQLHANEEDKKIGDDRDQPDLDPINQQEGKRRIAKTLVHEEAGKQEQERAQEEERVGFDELKNVTELADKKAGDAYGCQQQQQKSRAQQIAAIIHNHKQQQLQRIREHTAKQKERVEATADEHKQRQPWQELEKLTEDEEAKLFDDDERDQQQQQQSRAKDKQKEQNQRAEDKQMERVDEHKHRQLWQELETERAEEELARLKQREERMTKTKEERQLAVFRGFLAHRAEMEKREQRQQQGPFVDKDGRVLDLPLPPCRSNPLFVLDPGEEMLRELRAARLARFERDVQRILDMDR